MLERYQAMQIAGSWWCFGSSTVPLMAALHTSRWLQSGLHRISRLWSGLNNATSLPSRRIELDVDRKSGLFRWSTQWFPPTLCMVTENEIFCVYCCSCSHGHPCQVDCKADGWRSYGWKALLRRGAAASWTSLAWLSWRSLGRLRALICLWLMWSSGSPFSWVDWWIDFLIHSWIHVWINCRIKVFLCLCSFGHLNGSCPVRLWSIRF